MPPVTTLSMRASNRALLARQLLLERAELAIPDALERVAGIQDQYAPSSYIGLWSRLASFRREALTTALGDRSVAQGTLMRATIHLVSPADFRLFAAATRRERRSWWVRAQGRQLDGIDVDAAVTEARRLLADGPRRHADMVEGMATAGFPRVAWATAAQLIDRVRVPPSGTWEQRRADRYGLAADWLGPIDVPETEAQVHLVRRYLAGFGPASVADIVSWSGLARPSVLSALADLELVRSRDPQGVELLDLPGAPLPDPDTPAPVRFLPTWDATLLVHARRTGILPERFRPRIFSTKTPHSVPTFLVDGAVAGTWRHEDGRVTVDPFEPLSPAAIDAVEAEAQGLAAIHA